MMEIGLESPGVDWIWKDPDWSYKKIREFWIEAENLGFDSICTTDNIAWYDENTHEPMKVYEAWTLIAGLAEATSKIRIGPMMTPARRRHPALLAKMAATVDEISGGRLNLGIGPGDIKSYFDLWGMDFPSTRERIDALREELEILKLLLSAKEKEVSYRGEYYELHQAPTFPKPVQRPHPPIWMGLVFGTKLMPRMIAQYADAVDIYNGSDRAAKDLLEILASCCQELGRDFASIKKARRVYVLLSEDEEDLPAIAQQLNLPIEEQKKMMKTAEDPDLEYGKLGMRYVIGNPEQVAEQLWAILDLGFDFLVLAYLDTLPVLELFAKEVMPTLRKHK